MRTPARSKLFHTIVVMGLSVASSRCGTTGRILGDAPAQPVGGDGSPDDAQADATQDVASVSSTPADSATDAPDAEQATAEGDAGDAGGGGDACMQWCCTSPAPTQHACGACPPGTWPCYV